MKAKILNMKNVFFIKDLDEIPLHVRLCLYGAGGFCQHLLMRLSLDRPDIKIPFLIDTFKKGKRFGKDVMHPRSVVEERIDEYDIILVTADSSSREGILTTLGSLGIDQVMIGSEQLQEKVSRLNIDEGLLQPNFGNEIFKLNLGGGSRWKKEGWHNLDYSEGYDLGTSLLSSFKKDYIYKIYASHIFEHLRPERCYLLLKDCYRVLIKHGIFRIVVPDCEMHVRDFLNHRHSFFCDLNQKFFDSPLEQIKHMGGNPEGLHLKSKIGHFFFWDQYTLSWLLIMAGFKEIAVTQFGQSADPEFCETAVFDRHANLIDGFDNPHVSHISLYLEGRK